MNGLTFTTAMARAVCEGRKTQTRRLSGLAEVHAAGNPELLGVFTEFDQVNRCDIHRHHFEDTMGGDDIIAYPRYHVGKKLALLTTWVVSFDHDDLKPTELACIGKAQLWHAGMGTPKPCGKSRPGRFLPNHLRPLMPQLEITAVRCQRLQDITEDDAEAEGVEHHSRPEGGWDTYGKHHEHCPVVAYAQLWDSINLKSGHGWETNPWCFAYSCKLLSK